MRLRQIEPHLRRALGGPCRLTPGERLLVAVSGGADSTALLVGLARIAREFGLTLHAAHLHHGMRGKAADADLSLVRTLCTRLGIPLIAARCEGRTLMTRHGLTGENGLRVLRRRFLAAALRRSGAAAIATAHTADDQLETVLLRLLRGAGLRGLGGMRERHGRWIKPMLEATRLEVEADLRAARIAWSEDRSNRDLAMTRNRIRHRVIPALLLALDPAPRPARGRAGAPPEAARAALARRAASAAREAREAERALEVWLSRSRPGLCRIEGSVATVAAGRLASYPIAARRMALRRAWKSIAPSEVGLTRRHLAALCSLVGASRSRRRVDLPAGIRAERDHDAIRLIAKRAGTSPPKPMTRLRRPPVSGGRHPVTPTGAWREP